MTLIKCDECGKEISSKASSCPNCGNPIYQQQINEKNIRYVNRSWFDLSENEKELLKSEFDEKTTITRYSIPAKIIMTSSGLWTSIFGGLWLSNIIFDWVTCYFIVLVIWIAFCLVGFSIDEKNYNKEFNSWLKNSKNIYK